MIKANNSTLGPNISRGATVDGDAPLVTYERRLSADSRWALSDASDFFQGRGSVRDALRKIVGRLDELGIPYAVVGALALFEHGYRRFTEDVDLLVTQDGLRKIHEALDGLGYLPPFKGSRHLRDTELGVKIEFLVEGGFPGDGKPKPVAFPNPTAASIEIAGIRFINLPTVVDLKLASGMSNRHRLKDLVDVQEMIKVLQLPAIFREQLNPYVQAEYDRLWQDVESEGPDVHEQGMP